MPILEFCVLCGNPAATRDGLCRKCDWRLLCLNELDRAREEASGNFVEGFHTPTDQGELSHAVSAPIAQPREQLDEAPGAHEMHRASEAFRNLVENLQGGKISAESAASTLSEACDRYEQGAEQLKQHGQFELLMSWKAAQEARIKGLSGLAQGLASLAFLEAACGVTEPDWINGVLNGFPHSPKEPGIRRAYTQVLTALQKFGPWPWPRQAQ